HLVARCSPRRVLEERRAERSGELRTGVSTPPPGRSPQRLDARADRRRMDTVDRTVRRELLGPAASPPARRAMTDSPAMTGQILMDADALHQFMTEAFGQPLNWTIERVDMDGMRV